MKHLILILGLLHSLTAAAKINVVTTTTDLQALVETVGGDNVTAYAIAKGTQDPHQIEAKPSYMVKMRDADLVLAQGLELESAWIVPLIQGARNPKVAVGSMRFLELADKLEPIEVPVGNVTRAQGDVHPGGNPHFQVDPIRLGKAAVLIAAKLGEIDSANRALFKANAEKFQKHMEERTKEWTKRVAATKFREAVTFHKGLTYFLDRFGMSSPIQLEPRPGIPPTAAHLIEVVELMKKRDIHLVLIENYYDDKAGEKVKEDVPNAKIAVVPISVGGEPGIKDGEQLIERIVKIIEEKTR